MADTLPKLLIPISILLMLMGTDTHVLLTVEAYEELVEEAWHRLLLLLRDAAVKPEFRSLE